MGNRIIQQTGSATARASASGVAVVIEGLRDMYEQHRGWLIAATLVAAISFVVTRLFLNGWIALAVGACMLVLSLAFRSRGYKKKRVRVTRQTS
jgi:hypothetical protein